ncbi:MAG: hypothetical protein IJZ83_09735 [Clostridia bacterium]|nr:hypothetical protein [Clostridia bacterium]
MFPKPKTKRGEIGFQIINAVMIGIFVSCLVIPFIFAIKLCGSIDDGWFGITYGILLLFSFSFTMFIESILIFVRRIVFIRSKETPKTIFYPALKCAYGIIAISSIMYLVAFICSRIINIYNSAIIDNLFGSYFDDVLATIMLYICPPLILICIIAIVVWESFQKRLAKNDGVELFKPEISIYKMPIFYVIVIILFLLVCCIPIK